MEFSINTSVLGPLVKKLGAVVDGKHDLPAYTSIRVKSSVPGTVTFYVYSPLTRAEGRLFDVPVTTPFEFGTYEELFGKVVAALPKDVDAHFEVFATHVAVKAGKSSFKVNIFTDDIFMPNRNFDAMPFIDINFRELIDGIKRVSFCCDPNGLRDESKVVCINTDHFVATDGFCLSVFPNRVLKVPGEILIPGKAVEQLEKLYTHAGEKGKFFCTESEMNLSCNGVYSSTSLNVGKFVGYRSVLPHGPCDSAVVERDILIEAIDRVLVMSQPGMKNILLRIAVGEMTIYTNDGKNGEAQETVLVESAKACEEICVSGTKLLAVLKNYTVEKVTLEHRGVERAFIVTDKEHVNVIQPVRRAHARAAASA